MKYLILTASLISAFAVANMGFAQSQYFFRDPTSDIPLPAPAGPNGDWNVDDNWYEPSLGLHFIPDYSVGDGELARIENGGQAFVEDNITISPGQIILGSATGTSGSLEIRDGGVLASRQGVATNGNITVGSGGGTGTLFVRPGGTLTAEGQLAQGTGSSNLIVVGGITGAAANLNVNTAALPRTVQVFPNANFTTNGGANFSATANYISEISGNGASGAIDVGSTASLNGTLTLNFNSYTPSVGHNWTVVEAGTLNGGFSTINANVTLPFNQNFVVTQADLGGGREGLNVSVAEVLVLQVNRNTGTATITHPGSSSILVDGYFVGSEVGSLDPSARASVNNQGTMGSDWFDTAATPFNIGELKSTDDGTVPGGGSAQVSLGAIFKPLAGNFGQLNEDLEFDYRRSDGTKLNGVVRYTGTTVNTLLLQVDPTGTGDAYLRNTSDTTVQIDAYHVLSESGRLTTSGWNSFDEQNLQGANTWVQVSSSANLIGEFNQSIVTPYLTLSPGDALNLGPLFTGGTQDLEFSFLLAGQEDGLDGQVIYEAFTAPEGEPGDYNDDGTVDAADYVVWRKLLGQNVTLPNEVEGTTPGTVTTHDYDAWKTRFGNSSSGAGASDGSASLVPEPSAALLLWMAAFVVISCGARWKYGIV